MRSINSAAPRRMAGRAQPKAGPVAAPYGESHEAGMDEALAKHGITRVSADQFDRGGFHYTNLDDALAQAKRTDPTF